MYNLVPADFFVGELNLLMMAALLLFLMRHKL